MGSTSFNRRDVMKKAAATSLLAVPAVGALSSCASGGGEENKAEKGEKSKKNPLGVKADAALGVYIFNGGYGDKYAQFVTDMYQEKYPKSDADQKATTKIATQLQPKIVRGKPTADVVNNSGADQMNIGKLVHNKQVADLGEVLDAPSWDDPNVKVRDTLVPVVETMGQFGGKECYQLNIAVTVYGNWYSKKLLEEGLDSEYPKTWDEMLAVCKKAKGKGIHGWSYPGGHPRYMFFSMYAMFAQRGGSDVIDAMDYLEPGAWKHDAVKDVFEAWEELVSKKYVLTGFDGTEAHTEMQTAWTKGGKCLFVPNGSWVENEAKDTTPKDFQMTVGATPSLDSSDKMPFGTLYAPAGEPFIVPSKAKNVQGGLEWLRMMYSKEAALNLFKEVGSIPAVKGAVDGQKLPSGTASAKAAIEAAGDNVVIPKFYDWYNELFREDFNNMIAKFMLGQIGTKQAMDTMEKASERILKDPDVSKVKKA
ncbi:N-acetylglucosamine/diacetylchitobiose ABC transporter substrate-binding protein [Streptomyces sp. NBC_01381]|uniref:N-acetylglucosamine/diacetylchitobiose ABC transporter substrate-binding protein n=1 Tax=Streptomyces sp. NBC_01381 TaxID=2903845 RepID=UPI0022594D55|nr:N-acetylglucosamine/diacetylchitobiose ABC transporter substrate-binding protein [Streptomyces sp. NBC_01381]MCX4670686.1 N-acetylglucosamine/diacetylchitobiose ABC transporter substrate-binding protein [Streptomyces sp. NBC_01381]